MKLRLGFLFALFAIHTMADAQNVGIGITTPRHPLSFAGTTGQKISFWDDGNAQGTNYGIGVQPGLLQIHANLSADNIGLGFGSSTSFTERFRITGSGNLGLNTTAPNSYGHSGTSTIFELFNPAVQVPGQNTVTHLVLSSRATNGHLGGLTWASTGITGERRLSYIGTQIGASNTGELQFYTRSSLGSLLKRMTLNGAGTLRLDGPETLGTGDEVISIGGYGNIEVDAPGVQGGRVKVAENGYLGLNNANPASRLDVNGDVNLTGALKMNGNSGSTSQFLVSRGNALPEWATASNIIRSQWSGEAVASLHIPGFMEWPDATLNLSLTTPSRVYLYYKTATLGTCSIATACFTKWELAVFLDGTAVTTYIIDGITITGEVSNSRRTYRSLGPDILDIPAGNHAITFQARNIYGEPIVYLTPVAVMVPR